MIELKIDPEFRDKIPPLTDAEFEQLKENILADGEVYEPICVWNGTIVDGHNRWKIVQEHPEIPYRTKAMAFADKWEAFDWMYKKQLGRRNLTEEQKTYLLGKLYEARKNSQGGNRGNQYTKVASSQNGNMAKPHGRIGEIIAKEQGVGHGTVLRAAEFAQSVDKAEEVVPGFRQQVLSGELNVPKKDIAEIRKLESDEEVKAAVEEIRNPKPKTISNPNIPQKPKSKKTDEEREIEERVSRIIEIQNDKTRDRSITIDDLVGLVDADGEDYVSSLRNMLTVRSTLLVGDNRKKIADAIGVIIEKIEKVRRLLE